MALPLLLFSGLIGLAFWAAETLDDVLEGVPVTHFLLVWLGKPLLRVLPMLLFLVLSFPALYGWQSEALHQSGNPNPAAQLSALFNGLFLLSLILPQIPVLTRLHGPVLLLQLMLASAMVFRWQVEYLGLPLDAYALLPSPMECLIILSLSMIMHALTAWIADGIGHWFLVKKHLLHADHIAQESLSVLLQSPSLVLYTVFLGQQVMWPVH